MKQKSFAHLGRKLCAAFMACAMVLSSFSVSAQAEETSTTSMPTVKSYEKTSGSFVTAEQSRIYYVSDAAPEGDIADTLKLAVSESAAQGIHSGNVMDIVYGPQENVRDGDIVIRLGDVANDGADAQQAYEMDITEDNIVITAEGAAGIKYAMNVYAQNMGTMECGTIQDYPDVKERSIYLDCGRRFYNVDTLEAMIKDMSWNKMNTLYLDFSNNKGFRFALDDMTLTWADGTMSDDLSDVVSERTLTQSDMDEIIALADLYGVTIVPTLNSPGHMDTILAQYPQYQVSASTINLDDAEARSFAVSLVQKYADYFASRGCTIFNISADEATGYDTNSQTYVDYVNDLNAMLKDMGYQVRMFNDGIKTGDAALIDSDIQVLYWDPSTANANVYELLSSGHDLINIAADYMYYAYNNGSFICSANNIYDGTYVRETHNQSDEIAQHNQGWNPGKFSKMGVKQQMSFINGEFVYPQMGEMDGKIIGASYAIWSDNATDSVTDQEIIEDVYYQVRVTAERSWRVNTDSIQDPLYDDGVGYDVEQGSDISYEEFMNTQLSLSMAPGGLNSDGTVDSAHAQLPEAGEITAAEPEGQDQASEAAIAALQNMVEKANALGSDDAALQTAITAAQAVLDKDAPTSTEVVTALLNLSEAMQALNTDESTDALRADVQATIEFINENILTNVDGIRPGKVQALKDAVAAAEDLLANADASADELKAANEAMTKAAQELWEIVSKAELNALIEAANGYLDGEYTAESLEALQTAITAAQAVADNDDATTSEVTDAITNLSDAIAGLVEEAGVDKSALAHEIELVNEMIANLDDYVPSSVEGLADKLSSAQQVYDDANATQEEVDAATQALREARLNARTKADVSALEEIIAYANSLDLSGYSRASVAALNQAIAQNKLMLNDPEVSQDTVDAAVTEIQNAIDALEPASSASVDGAGTAASSGTSFSVTNTAAQAQTGLFVGVLAVAACGVLLMVIKKRRNKA